MVIDFSYLILGETYDRPTLAKNWGYKSFHAISRGVVTPKDQRLIIFFITKEKQEVLTQYIDHIEQDILFWEGEKEHRSDKRIVSGEDEIYIFYRERHHSDFIYKGRAQLRTYQLLIDRPSKFSFFLIDNQISDDSIVSDIQASYSIPETEREAIISSRIGQGIYRKNSLDLWQNCSVTGFSKKDILIASHIKPWKISSNEERLNPHNSLILVPTLDKLFDRGYISFDSSNRQILLSEQINLSDWKKVGITRKLKLNKVPDGTKKFLEYHNEYIFDLIQSK